MKINNNYKNFLNESINICLSGTNISRKVQKYTKIVV